jgi:solute carrier family 13 (sodium-dependent dicarboxylate transporter), member 2/3/5
MKKSTMPLIGQKEMPTARIEGKRFFSFCVTLLAAWGIFLLLPASFPWAARMMTSIVVGGVILWALEPVPLGLTSILIVVAMLLFDVVPMDVAFSGFASPAVFLIIAGMMLAQAVNQTNLVKRVAYYILARCGGTAKGILAGILLINQIQAFFIPATAVRTTLTLPIALMLLELLKTQENHNLRKLILLGMAFGGNISGTAIMTAAIGNILTVELVNRYLGMKISYFEWLLYAFPIWILLIPATWLLLVKMYPLEPSAQSFPQLKREMENKLQALGKLQKTEKKCLFIMVATVLLWMTEPLHGLHPSVTAFVGVTLMAFPVIGFTTWEHVVKINFNTVLLLGTTLSMGYALNESRATDLLGEIFSAPWIGPILQHPPYAVIFVVVVAQIFHLAISNVSTSVVTLLPIVIGLSRKFGVDPFLLCFVAGLTSLHGYILVVETMPNLIVHSTGLIEQKDFIRPGIYMTLLTMFVTVFVALTWWRWIGLL